MPNAPLIDLETHRAKRMGPRKGTTAGIQDGVLHITFPVATERLELTAAQARFWRDMLSNFIPDLEAEEAARGSDV